MSDEHMATHYLSSPRLSLILKLYYYHNIENYTSSCEHFCQKAISSQLPQGHYHTHVHGNKLA